ncbi:MAG: zinc-binding dehydrogenase, partial [Chloroflexota bacterium]|nr:zinc-binding dehydrogenase [Chloroflexota bacterium]
TQLAKLRGSTVIASVASADAHEARALGADHVVDRAGDLSDQVRAIVPGGVDAALDAANAPGALSTVRDGGRYIGTLLPVREAERGITPRVVFVQPDPAQLADLVGLVDAGLLRLRTAAVYPLARAVDAYARIAAGGVRGRVLLVPEPGLEERSVTAQDQERPRDDAVDVVPDATR